MPCSGAKKRRLLAEAPFFCRAGCAGSGCRHGHLQAGEFLRIGRAGHGEGDGVGPDDIGPSAGGGGPVGGDGVPGAGATVGIGGGVGAVSVKVGVDGHRCGKGQEGASDETWGGVHGDSGILEREHAGHVNRPHVEREGTGPRFSRRDVFAGHRCGKAAGIGCIHHGRPRAGRAGGTNGKWTLVARVGCWILVLGRPLLACIPFS